MHYPLSKPSCPGNGNLRPPKRNGQDHEVTSEVSDPLQATKLKRELEQEEMAANSDIPCLQVVLAHCKGGGKCSDALNLSQQVEQQNAQVKVRIQTPLRHGR